MPYATWKINLGSAELGNAAAFVYCYTCTSVQCWHMFDCSVRACLQVKCTHVGNICRLLIVLVYLETGWPSV